MGSRDYYFQILVVNRQGYIDELKDIFSKHLDIHEVNAENNTNYLHIALQNATQTTPPIETIQFYLDHQLDVNLQDHLGNTPLHYAVSRSNIPCALLLLQSGASPNIANHQHICPLGMLPEINHQASRIALLNAMLDQGGDVSLPNGRLNIADSYAFKSQTDASFEAIVALIQAHQATQQPTTPAPATSADSLSESKSAITNTTPPTTNNPSKPLPEHIEKEIHLLIQENILLSSEITPYVMEQFQLREAALPSVQQAVRECKQQFMASQKTWPGMTDCEKLLLAFYALFKQDIIALPAVQQGIQEVEYFQNDYQGKQVFQGFCFFNTENIRQAITSQKLPIHFGVWNAETQAKTTHKQLSKLISDRLKEQNLQVDWDDNSSQLTIHHFSWQNRTDFNLFKSKYLK